MVTPVLTHAHPYIVEGRPETLCGRGPILSWFLLSRACGCGGGLGNGGDEDGEEATCSSRCDLDPPFVFVLDVRKCIWKYCKTTISVYVAKENRSLSICIHAAFKKNK